MWAGGLGCFSEVSSSAAAGLVKRADNMAADVIVSAIFFSAGTIGNVQAEDMPVGTYDETRRE